MMHILGWIVFGLVVGIIARFLIPGPQPMGTIVTILLGIAGSFFGGLVVNLFQGHDLTDLRATGWIGSILGAIALILIYSVLMKRTA